MRRLRKHLSETVWVPRWVLLLWMLALIVVTTVDVMWAAGAV